MRTILVLLFFAFIEARSQNLTTVGEHLETQTFVICDIVGKHLEYKSTFISENTQEIPLLTAAPGLYFVKVFNAQGVCVQKSS